VGCLPKVGRRRRDGSGGRVYSSGGTIDVANMSVGKGAVDMVSLV
jgi:hypothetical protein